MTLGSEAGSLNHFSLGNTSNELPILPEVIQPAAKVCDFEEVPFLSGKHIYVLWNAHHRNAMLTVFFIRCLLLRELFKM